jgi:hypothetical protein
MWGLADFYYSITKVGGAQAVLVIFFVKFYIAVEENCVVLQKYIRRQNTCGY